MTPSHLAQEGRRGGPRPGRRRGDAAAELVGDSLFVVQAYLSGVAVMDFHKGATAMARGAEAVREVEPRIRALLG